MDKIDKIALGSEIENFISDNEQMEVEVSPGVTYYLRDVIENSNRLWNARFQSGDTEQSGFVRIFTRKMWVVYRTLVMGSDLDMKHLNIRSLNGIKVKLVSFLKMCFVSHLNREFFGELMDKIMSEMCWFGTSIVKRYEGTVGTVDLRNYITESSIENPQERRHLEMCYYTYDRVLANKEEWKENWEDIQRVWEQMKKNNESKFKILEFWTWGEVDGKIRKICAKALDNTLTKDFHNVNDWKPYIVLDAFTTPYQKRRKSKLLREKLGDKEDMFPYEQFDLFKAFGRSIAFGCGELLAGVEEMYDELFNEKRKMDKKARNGNYVHTGIIGNDGAITQLLQESISNLVEGGVVTLYPGEQIAPLPVDTRNSDFQIMEEKIYELMRQIIGVTSQGTGEEAPASTSATQASINQQNANTVFDYVRERMYHGMKRLFNNGYAEDIINELEEAEVISIIGDPKMLQEMDKEHIDMIMNEWAFKVEQITGQFPSEEEYEAEKERLTMDVKNLGDTRFPEFKKEIIKGMEYMFDFEITGEAFDTKLRSDALIAMKNDPTSTKSKSKIEDELLSLQGLTPSNYDKSPEELKKEEEMRNQQLMAESGMLQAPAQM